MNHYNNGMEILIIGQQAQLEEVRQKFGDAHKYLLAHDLREAEKLAQACDLLFDFTVSENPSPSSLYRNPFSFVAFLDTSMVSLQQLGVMNFSGTAIGFCGMPTFLNRDLLEVALLKEDHRERLKQVCAELGTDYKVVADRVGLVTPRIICMIINEAFHTVREGTATREDIDLAMKLGTNYPFGPFEWCKRIGIKNVRDLLVAMYEDTKDERYKICPLLNKEAGP